MFQYQYIEPAPIFVMNQLSSLPDFDCVDGVWLEPVERGLGDAAIDLLPARLVPSVHAVRFVEDCVSRDGRLIIPRS